MLAHRESRDYLNLFPMVQSWVIFWCRPVTNLHKPTLTPLAGEPFGRMMAETPIKSSLQKKIFFVQM